MKTDALALARMDPNRKPCSKEILNHVELLRLASGYDPLEDTQKAYLEAYRSLGIDLIKRVPTGNALPPLCPGETRDRGNGYSESYGGLYNSVARHRFPFDDVDDFWKADTIEFDINALSTPEPHVLDKEDIEKRMRIAGDIGLYYYRLYTTLFMWGVEILGWEIFMIAAITDPEGFDEKFLQPALRKSHEYIDLLSGIDSPFVVCHDDLADQNGPVFPPSWYDRYIFPKYEQLWEPAKRAGKKILFVADGNMGPFLKPLRETGVDGVVLENPATDFDLILEHFSDRYIIGGIDARLLYNDSPANVRRHVLETHAKTRSLPGYAMSVCGGIHGGIPMENLEMYFDVRARLGYNSEEWRRA